MDKNTFLAIVLSLVVIFTWQAFFAKKPVPQQAASVKQEATTAVDKQSGKETVAEPVKTVQPQTRTILSKPVTGTEKDIPIETPLYSATFTSRGGALKSFKLKTFLPSASNSWINCWRFIL